jgi:hypothetical protein
MNKATNPLGQPYKYLVRDIQMNWNKLNLNEIK